MKEGRGIPVETVEELDVNNRREETPVEVNVLVEHHQAKIPIPKNIRLKLKLEKGNKAICLVSFNEKTKEMLCKFQ
jgi:hypothetical protein